MVFNDAHCHFFSQRRFSKRSAVSDYQHPISGRAVAEQLGWETSDDAAALADRWVAELDQHGGTRIALMASIPGDEDSVAAAVRRHPNRIVGFFALNPLAADAIERAERALTVGGLRCICLFPAMHHYSYQDERVFRIFELAPATAPPSSRTAATCRSKPAPARAAEPVRPEVRRSPGARRDRRPFPGRAGHRRIHIWSSSAPAQGLQA